MKVICASIVSFNGVVTESTCFEIKQKEFPAPQYSQAITFSDGIVKLFIKKPQGEHFSGVLVNSVIHSVL